jgi:hypothetical protein
LDAKRKEAEAARQKATLQTAGGLFREPVATKVAPKPSDGYPAFDESLLGRTGDSSLFRLPNSRYYCIECLQEGLKEDFSAPQGLATHRGFRHQMYLGHGTVKEINRVNLPEEIHTAIELLRSSVAEHLEAAPEDPEVVAGLQKELAESRSDIQQGEEAYKKLKTASDAALFAEQQKSAELQKKLTEALASIDHHQGLLQTHKERHEAEMAQFLETLNDALRKIRASLDGSAPLQAVGEIDLLVKGFGI